MKILLPILLFAIFLNPTSGSAQFVNTLKLEYQNPGINNNINAIAEITLPSTPGGPRLNFTTIVTGDTLFISACYTSGPLAALSQIRDTIKLGGTLPPGIRGVHFRSYWSGSNTTCDSTLVNKKIIPFFIGTPTGISKTELSTLKIYPNPAKDHFIIAGPTVCQAQLYNLQGQLLKRFTFHDKIAKQISTAELPAGLYLLEITTGNGAVYRKQVVKN